MSSTMYLISAICAILYSAINAIMGVLDAPAGLVTTLLGCDDNVLAFVEFCTGAVAVMVIAVIYRFC